MPNVCIKCIGEGFLNQMILESGEVATCEFCKSEDIPVICVDELASQVHSVLEEHYYMTSPEPEGLDYLAAKYGEWEQPGEEIVDVIGVLLESSEEVAEAVREVLSEAHDPIGKDAMIEPALYATDSKYEEQPIDVYEFRVSWESFREEILTRSRFFNRKAESTLDHLFNGIADLETCTSEPVVRQLDPDHSIYRGRLADSGDKLDEILKYLPKSLGAPSGGFSSAGRMNPEGILAFYGASDIDTCIAEIRAPVGSFVISGRFVPLRALRILDFTRLRDVFLQGSLFDPNHTEALSRVHFLKELERELSQPVLPGTERRAHLPTQVVAEYLASQPEMDLDGLMFSSSQVAAGATEDPDLDGEIAGRNIVLFSRACRLERYALPEGTRVDVYRLSGDPDDPELSVYITERVPADGAGKENQLQREVDLECGNALSPSDAEATESDASIKLDLDSVEVRLIQGVSYRTLPLDVTRNRVESGEIEF